MNEAQLVRHIKAHIAKGAMYGDKSEQALHRRWLAPVLAFEIK